MSKLDGMIRFYWILVLLSMGFAITSVGLWGRELGSVIIGGGILVLGFVLMEKYL